MRQNNALFANFVCHFGTDKVLLDYAKEIVIPALTNPAMERRYGKDTRYFITDSEFINLGDVKNPILAISGRFIKNTVLRRHQIFHPEHGVVQDNQTMPSAPSATFLLILNNHRLVYFPETPHAPDLPAFEAAVRKFISVSYKEYLKKLRLAAKGQGSKITVASLQKEYGPPVVNIIPFSNRSTIEGFLSQFSRLQSIEFELIKPNQEIDGSSIWRKWREHNDELHPDKTVVRTEKAEGFNIGDAGKQIAEAAGAGNQRIRLKGRDLDDNKIDGDNNNFRVTAPVFNPPTQRRELASRLFTIFTGLLKAGTIKADAPTDDV